MNDQKISKRKRPIRLSPNSPFLQFKMELDVTELYSAAKRKEYAPVLRFPAFFRYRDKVVCWITEVIDDLGMDLPTLGLAVTIFDRILFSKDLAIQTTILQALGCIAILISGLDEICFVNICSDHFFFSQQNLNNLIVAHH